MTTSVYTNPGQVNIADTTIQPGFVGGVQIQIGLSTGGPYSVGTLQIPLTSWSVSAGAATLSWSAFVAATTAAGITFTDGIDYYCQAEVYSGTVIPIPTGDISVGASPESAFVLTAPPPPPPPANPTNFSFGAAA